MNFEKVWSNYIFWTKENITNDNYLNTLGLPASEQAILDLEKRIGIELYTDLKSMLLTHNGIDDVKFIYEVDEFLSTESIYKYWKTGVNVLNEELNYVNSSVKNSDDLHIYNKENNPDYFLDYDNGIKWIPFSNKWMPIMVSNGGTLIWYIDNDPDEHNKGVKGQIIEYYPEGGEARIVSESYLSFLQKNLDELKQGKYLYDSYGNLVLAEDILKIEDNIAKNGEILEESIANTNFNEIDNLSTGDEFTLIGVITCENYFVNEIKKYKDSLKKTAFIERAKLKTKELVAPRLNQEGECFILVGDKHLKLSNPLELDLSELSLKKVVKANIKVVEVKKYDLVEFSILK